MRHDVNETLASHFTTHRIERQLHDIPPHEVYEVSVDGQHAVYKGNTGPTGRAAIEGRVIALIGEQTSVPVPEIILSSDDFYVAAWHSDVQAPNEQSALDETWASAAGRGLAMLHNETACLIDKYGQFQVQNDSLEIAGHETWHAAAIASVRRHRSVLTQYGHADIADAVVDSLEDHPDVFRGVGGPVCCHGWATPEHVSVKDGRVACMIDFEHAIAAPGEFDYWRTVLPTFRQNTNGLQQAFRTGYESVRSLPTGFERRQPLYMLLNEIYYLESLYVQAKHGPEETTERAGWLRDSISKTLDEIQ